MAPAESRLRALLRSPSRLTAILIGLILLFDLPGAIDAMRQATPGELAVLVVVAPLIFGLGLFFIYRFWFHPTRTIIVAFLIVWVTPAVATIVGGGLQAGSFVPLVLDVLVAVLAAFALNEPRTGTASEGTG